MANLTHQPPNFLDKVSLLDEFLDTLPLQYRTIVALAYFTSSRISDVLSLKISDITSDQIVIEQSELGTPKCVPILSCLQPYLTVYLNGSKTRNSEFLFPDKLGNPLDTSMVFKVLQLVAKQVHLPDMYLFAIR